MLVCGAISGSACRCPIMSSSIGWQCYECGTRMASGTRYMVTIDRPGGLRCIRLCRYCMALIMNLGLRVMDRRYPVQRPVVEWPR